MNNCSIHITASHDYAWRDWDLNKINGKWQRERTGGHIYREGGNWSAADDAIAESIIDALIAEAIAAVDNAPNQLRDNESLASAERDGITVDIFFNITEEA